MHPQKRRGKAKEQLCPPPSPTLPKPVSLLLPRLRKGTSTRPRHLADRSRPIPSPGPKAPVSMAANHNFLKIQAAEVLQGSTLSQGAVRLHHKLQNLLGPFQKAQGGSPGNVRCYWGGRMCLNHIPPTLQGRLTECSGLTSPLPQWASAGENVQLQLFCSSFGEFPGARSASGMQISRNRS